MGNRNIIKLFESRKGNLDYRLKRDYIKNGIATLPCSISDYNDVISAYSVQADKTLNAEFFDYIKTSVGFVPLEYPIVLNIIGNCLSQEERIIIKDTIRDDFAYKLGMVEKEEKRHIKVFLLLLVGLILSGISLYLTHTMADEPRGLFFILFWFTGYTLCDYIFLTGHELRKKRQMAGRLASIKVVFSEKYEDPNYTDRDVDRLLNEIKKDMLYSGR